MTAPRPVMTSLLSTQTPLTVGGRPGPDEGLGAGPAPPAPPAPAGLAPAGPLTAVGPPDPDTLSLTLMKGSQSRRSSGTSRCMEWTGADWEALREKLEQIRAVIPETQVMLDPPTNLKRNRESETRISTVCF